MNLEWFLSLSSALALLLLAYFFKHYYRSWLAPSAFFSGYWSIALAGVLIFAPEFEFWYPAGWIIVSFCLMFGFGELLVRSVLIKQRNLGVTTSSKIYRIAKWGNPILLSLLALGVAGQIILIFESEYSLNVISHPEMLLLIGLENASRRYEYDETNMQVVFFNMFTYLGAFFGGTAVAIKKSRLTWFLACAILLTGLLNSVLVNARTGMIWLFIFFLASYLSIAVYKKKHITFLSIRRVFLGILVIVIFVFFFFSLQLVREAQSNSISEIIQAKTISEITQAKTKVSFFGSPPLFSMWLKSNWTSLDAAYGGKTFNGFFSLVGLTYDESGLGWEPMMLEMKDGIFISNVYTAFRQIIEDFTLPGSFIFFIVLGAFIGVAYQKVLSGNNVWYPILTIFYSVTLGSYLSNWLYYTSLFLAWVMLFGINGFFLRINLRKFFLDVYRRIDRIQIDNARLMDQS